MHLIIIRMSILDRYCPKIKKRIKRDFQPVWLNTEIRKLMKQRDLYKSRKLYDAFKKLRNECKKKVRQDSGLFRLHIMYIMPLVQINEAAHFYLTQG